MGNRQSLYCPTPFPLKKQFFLDNVYDTSLFTETNLHYPRGRTLVSFTDIEEMADGRDFVHHVEIRLLVEEQISKFLAQDSEKKQM